MRIESSFNNVTSSLKNAASTSNPSSIPISEKMTSQERGLDQATKNSQDAINLARTAEGSLNSVSESLGRIRELSVQASNGILSDSDRGSIQDEINGLKSSISDSLQNTEFNSIKLFDGFEGNIQRGPNSGQGQQMTIQNTSLESLGINDFDVTGEFDIADIDNAIEKVSEARSDLGVTEKGLEANIRYNETARENTLSSRSNAIGEDFEKSIIELRQAQLQQQVQNQVQTLKQTEEEDRLNILG